MTAEVLVVVGGTGGVGASTVAALLARRRAVGGTRVALVELDEGRGGAEVLLGIENRPGLRWADLAHLRGTVVPADLEGLLPLWQDVEVLSSDRRDAGPPPAASTAVWDALIGGCTTVVVDLPARRLLASSLDGSADPVPAAALRARTDCLLVTGQDVLGVAAALAVRAVLGTGPSQLVLRRRRAARVAPLEAAHVVDLPLLALLPDDRSLAEAVDRGFGPLPRRRSRLDRAIERTARGAGRG